jgi:hypothetical protein
MRANSYRRTTMNVPTMGAYWSASVPMTIGMKRRESAPSAAMTSAGGRTHQAGAAAERVEAAVAEISRLQETARRLREQLGEQPVLP